MKVRSISRRLTLTYVVVSLVTIVIMESLFFLAISNYYRTGMEQTLINHAEASATLYNRYAPVGNIIDKQGFIYENMNLEESALVEVWGTDHDFIVNNLGDTEHATDLTEDYYQALERDTTAHWRGKISTNEPVLSVSTPIRDKNRVVGVLRYVSSLNVANAAMRSNMLVSICIGLVMLVLAGAMGYGISARILIPVKNLIRVTKEISTGNLQVRAKKYYPDEIGQLSDAINMMTKELRRGNQERSDFISSISHELRTPLTSIKGWAETIEDAQDEPEIVEMGLNIIGRETNRLIILVNDLLDFSKLQSHRLELHAEKFELDQFVFDVAQEFAVRAKEENVILGIKLECKDAIVYGDKNRLKQVIINVLDNAFKFVSTSKEPSIRIQTQILEDRITISIEDNGPGMGAQELMRVKEKFYKGSSKMSGTGLGLSIANEIVALHQGNFYLDSIRNVGTRVTIMLPYFVNEELEDFIQQFNREQHTEKAPLS